MNNKKTIITLKSGVISILLMLIWTILIYSTNIQNRITTLMQYLFFSVGIFSAHYFYKKEYGRMTYVRGIKLGLGVSTIVGLFYSILIFLSLLLDKNKTVLKTIKDSAYKAFKNKGLNEEAIQSFLIKIEKIVTPFKSAVFIFLFMIFVGLILSLILSIFTKQNNNE
ncbi:MAG: DUF4199 domain-containing protein [Bacteroidetes bacterium]|nr:DUF4199 domain-containing protein [Bacteroidota bacterium]